MKTVSLGNAPCEVSALCLGTMYFGTTVAEADAFRLLDAYVEAGGAFLDTANKYACWVPGGQGGESESVLGRWMKERRNRAGLFIATKVGLAMPGMTAGLRRAQIVEACEQSLQRLGTEVIDLYYAHADDRETPLEESLAAFDQLQRAGKVRFLGASNFTAWRLQEARGVSEAHGWPQYVCAQLRHTYLRCDPWVPLAFAAQRVATPELLDYCRERNVRLLAYSPLLGGAYSRADRPLEVAYRCAENDARLARLGEMARGRGATINQMVLAWLMQGEPTAIPVMAASNLSQVHENLGALELRLESTELARLALKASAQPAELEFTKETTK